MPRRNRVQPTGDILAHPARGAFMGNRGILHDPDGKLTPARWRHKAWVTCLLSFKGRKRQLMAPGHYTELFFHDEAVAFAAGHRPCGECRRDDFNRFRDAAGIKGRIADYDNRLHEARAVARIYRQRRHQAQVRDLPDGCFILDADGKPMLVRDDALYPFAPEGYRPPIRRPKSGIVTLLTPPPLVAAIQAGYGLRLRLTA